MAYGETEYYVIRKTGAPDLEVEVKSYLRRGWKLYGSMSMAYDSRREEMVYCQPVVRD